MVKREALVRLAESQGCPVDLLAEWAEDLDRIRVVREFLRWQAKVHLDKLAFEVVPGELVRKQAAFESLDRMIGLLGFLGEKLVQEGVENAG